MPTKIPYCDETWNPIVGCSPCSPGCQRCYAAAMAWRLKAMGHEQYQDVVTKDANGVVRWTGEVRMRSDILAQPRHWVKGRTIFVCSMSDLLGDAVPDAWIDYVRLEMQITPQHDYLVLTKRPERLGWFAWPENISLGVSASTQSEFQVAMSLLSELRARNLFLSLEPLLAPLIDTDDMFTDYAASRWLDCVIVGGETGKGARAMAVEWVREIRDACVAHGVTFCFKDWGAGTYLRGRELDGRTWDELPWPVRARKGAKRCT